MQIKTWIPFTQECFVTSLVESGPVVMEEDFLKFRQFIYALSYLSPRLKVCGPSFKQNWIPFTQGCIVPSFEKVGRVVLYIFKFRLCIFTILEFWSPLGKGNIPSFEQTWIPLTQECFVPILAKIGPVVLEKK